MKQSRQRDRHQSEFHTTLEIIFTETQIQNALQECDSSYQKAATRLFKNARITYDHMADFWTLGVLMYQLLTGKKVFRSCKMLKLYGQVVYHARHRNSIGSLGDNDNIVAIQKMSKSQQSLDKVTAVKFAILHHPLEFPEKYFDLKARDFCSGLLTRNRRIRLGAEGGCKEILQHPWISHYIAPEDLLNGNVKPPFVPKSAINVKHQSDIGHAKRADNRLSWTEEDQLQIGDWDFVHRDRFEMEAVTFLEWEKGKKEGYQTKGLKKDCRSSICSVQ